LLQAQVMMSDKLLSDDLLASLYAAATQQAAWSTFCDRLSHSLNASVLMFGHSSQSHDNLGLVGGNIDPVHLQTYEDHYGSLNPWMSMNLQIKPGFVGVSDWALPRGELIKTEFYNDWLRHQNDAIAGPAMICHRSAKKFISIAASASAQIVDTDLSKMVEIMRTLSPHILRCVDISSTLNSGNGATPSHLNASRHGIVFIHRSGRTGFINDAATDLLETSKLLSKLQNGGLGSADPTVSDYMIRAAGAITNEAISDLPTPLTVYSVGLGQCTIHPHIFPAWGQQEFPENVWADPVAGAIVVTGSGGMGDDYSAEGVARSFGATPAEAKLAGAVILGQSLYEFADRHGLSRHTVRNQMRALLAKSESRDQIDFVRKIHQHISPFKTINRADH
jgi:DNA-binding CsgD family transcriptional regulator